MRALCLLACTAALVLGLAHAQQPADSSTAPIQELPAFSRLQACVPFNVLVQPSLADGPAYGLQVDAAPEVEQALSAIVQGEALLLETDSFVTQEPIKVVVYLPPERLAALDLLGFGGSIYVNQGFDVDSFTLRLGTGGGSAYVFNITAANASVQTQSNGQVVLTGSYGNVDLTASGISTVYIAGATEAVNVDLSGISDVYLQPASTDVQIAGRGTGISTVVYTQGQCSVQSAFLLSSPCQQSSAINLQVPSPSWTQGLTAVGSFSCGLGEGFLSQAPQGLPSFQAPELQFPTFQPTPITTAQMVPAAQAAAPAPTPVPAAPAEPAAAPAPTEVAAALQAPPPEAEAQPILASNPYAYGLQTPTGSQFQAGSVTPQATRAQSAATGQRQASAVSVAGPQGARTGTSSDNTGFTAGTAG